MDVVHLAIMATSVLVGLAVRRLVPRTPGLSRGESLVVGLAAVCGGAIGAKLPFLFEDLAALRSFAFWTSDGRTITWALATGYVAVELAKLAVGVRQKTGDGFAAPVAAAVAVGRIGCFQAGCCYGMPTSLPWGVDFGDGLARHPSQLYEVGFHALAAIALVWMGRSGVQRHQHFKLYLAVYAVFRFVTEPLRPEPAWVIGLTFYQVTVMGIFAMMVAHYVWDARTTKGIR
jgi:phosphatidylglycerol:prolipoprotein diacylglycerol transferase